MDFGCFPKHQFKEIGRNLLLSKEIASNPVLFKEIASDLDVNKIGINLKYIGLQMNHSQEYFGIDIHASMGFDILTLEQPTICNLISRLLIIIPKHLNNQLSAT